MSRGNDAELAAILVVAVMLAICGAIVSYLSVPWVVAFNVLPKLVVWAGLFGGAVYFGFFNMTWPVFLGALIHVFSPVLNHWAGGHIGETLYIEPAWYGKELWQWAMSILIAGSGYGLQWWQSNKYYY